MNWLVFGVGAAWCGGGFAFGTFVEYWGHRFMHAVAWGPGKTHREHHARGSTQGVLLEFWEYFKYVWIFMWPPLLISRAAGIGWLLGTNAYVLFSAFAHQLQHENPAICFWMADPLHFIHHAIISGITISACQSIFGIGSSTYKPPPRQQGLELHQSDADRRIWQINWLWNGNAEANRRMAEERQRKHVAVTKKNLLQ